MAPTNDRHANPNPRANDFIWIFTWTPLSAKVSRLTTRRSAAGFCPMCCGAWLGFVGRVLGARRDLYGVEDPFRGASDGKNDREGSPGDQEGQRRHRRTKQPFEIIAGPM